MFTPAQMLALADILGDSATNIRRVVGAPPKPDALSRIGEEMSAEVAAGRGGEPVAPPVPEVEGFPGYPVADLPPLPEGWRDSTYRNEGCPSYQCGLSRVLMDYAEPSQRFDIVELEREAPNLRFQVDTMGFRDGPDGGPVVRESPGGDGWAFESEEWGAVVAFVGDREAARRLRATRMVALMRNLHRAVSALYAEYERTDGEGDAGSGSPLNAEQPAAEGVYAASLDEWAVACGVAVERWQERAEV